MEEWHQKLHNNTSPDDVIICQVLSLLLQCTLLLVSVIRICLTSNVLAGIN